MIISWKTTITKNKTKQNKMESLEHNCGIGFDWCNDNDKNNDNDNDNDIVSWLLRDCLTFITCI